MKKRDEVYVIGHKNPDTDSICSAISYAYLKNKTEKGIFSPRRAGKINAESSFVLNYFGVKEPEYMPDAATTVAEIEIHEVKGVREDISVKKAWEIMTDENIVTLPITSDDGRLKGLITVSDIAKSYMDIYDNDVLSKAHTQYKSIVETLDGEMLVGDENQYFDKGNIVIGAFHPDAMESHINENDLVITGNRLEDQLTAMDQKASCVVIGLGAKVTDTIKRLAMDLGCTLISSPHSTYMNVRLITQSIPIRYLMKSENLLTFQIDDKVDDIREIMANSRHRDYPILDKNGKYVGTISRRNLIGAKGKKLILVDHNEKSQAVEHVEEADIREIIDHHRLGSLETLSPILFRNQPVGCTATILYQMYQEKQVKIPKNIAGLLCSAIISDTLLFRSPTCTGADRKAAKALADLAGIKDLKAYASQMFHAASNLDNKTADEIFYQDFKTFVQGNLRFGVGQISSMDTEELNSIKDKLMPNLEKEMKDQHLDMVFFMLTSIIDESTELLFMGNKAKSLIAEAFETEPNENSCLLPGIISRKKQLIPSFMSVMQQDRMR